MNPKFDGPSFVNPSHTSFNLDNGKNYQTPKMNFNSNQDDKSGEFTKKEIGKAKGKPMGGKTIKIIFIFLLYLGWEDDDKPETIPKVNRNVYINQNSTSEKNLPNVHYGIPNKIQNKSEESSKNSSNSLPNTSGYNAYINYWDAETSRKIQSSTMSV